MRRSLRLPLAGLAALLLTFAGCTVQRFQADTAATLEWLRLTNGSRIDATARWQLPRGTRIEVVEIVPAPDPAWLSAAQSGVDLAYPGVGRMSDAPYQLLVAWPRQQSSMDLQVALVRRADGVLVEAAALRATPHWFAPQSAAPDLVQTAFHDFAETLTTRY